MALENLLEFKDAATPAGIAGTRYFYDEGCAIRARGYLLKSFASEDGTIPIENLHDLVHSEKGRFRIFRARCGIDFILPASLDSFGKTGLFEPRVSPWAKTESLTETRYRNNEYSESKIIDAKPDRLIFLNNSWHGNVERNP